MHSRKIHTGTCRERTQERNGHHTQGQRVNATGVTDEGTSIRVTQRRCQCTNDRGNRYSRTSRMTVLTLLTRSDSHTSTAVSSPVLLSKNRIKTSEMLIRQMWTYPSHESLVSITKVASQDGGKTDTPIWFSAIGRLRSAFLAELVGLNTLTRVAIRLCSWETCAYRSQAKFGMESNISRI